MHLHYALAARSVHEAGIKRAHPATHVLLPTLLMDRARILWGERIASQKRLEGQKEVIRNQISGSGERGQDSGEPAEPQAGSQCDDYSYCSALKWPRKGDLIWELCLWTVVAGLAASRRRL